MWREALELVGELVAVLRELVAELRAARPTREALERLEARQADLSRWMTDLTRERRPP
jgi:hypothetical protein